jgi:hypothetical protein
LGIEQTALEAFLERSGYNPREVLDGWYEKGWTVTTGGKNPRRKKQMRVDGAHIWGTAITRAAVDQLGAQLVTDEKKLSEYDDPFE